MNKDLRKSINLYETDKLSDNDTMKLFSKLIKLDLIKSLTLQSHYEYATYKFIEKGYLDKEGNILKMKDEKDKQKDIWYEHGNATIIDAKDNHEDYVYRVKRKHVEQLLNGDIDHLIFDTRYYGKKKMGDIRIRIE